MDAGNPSISFRKVLKYFVAGYVAFVAVSMAVNSTGANEKAKSDTAADSRMARYRCRGNRR